MLLFLLALLFPFWGRRRGDAVEDVFCLLNLVEEGVCVGAL